MPKTNNQRLFFKEEISTQFIKNLFIKKLKQSQYSQIQIRYDEGKDLKITFFGALAFVNQLISFLKQFVDNLQGKIFDYQLNFNDQQVELIQKDQQFKKLLQSKWNLTIKYNHSFTVLAKINIQPHHSLGLNLPEKQIIFQKQFNFDSLIPKSIFFIKGKQQLLNIKRSCILPLKKQIAQKQKSNPDNNVFVAIMDEEKSCFYYYMIYNPLLLLTHPKFKKSFTSSPQIYMHLPDIKTFNTHLKKFLQKLCSDEQIIKHASKIVFICKQNHDIQSILNLKEGKNTCKPQIQRKWYIQQNNKKLFYSQKGNIKIQQALQTKLKEIEFKNQDMYLQVPTHKLDFQRNVMIHTVSGKSFPLTIHPNKITYQLFGQQKQIPDSQYQKIPKIPGTQKLSNCELSIGCYHIDLVNKIQTNLFSVFQRKMNFDKVEVKEQIYQYTLQYDIKKPTLVFQYTEQKSKNIQNAVAQIKQCLNKKLVEIIKPFDKDFTLEMVRKFVTEAKQQNIGLFLSQDKQSAIFKAYNDKNLNNFIKMLSHVGKIPIEFPKQWQNQTQQIQTFVVAKNTTEFQAVQKAFTLGNIVELVRIQNKLIYKKYYEQKLCLQQLNGGKQIKQMMLYHGTGSTHPKIIYEDKEQSFNINYTRQTNLLGRGTYFAERSQYSLYYSFVEDQGEKVKSMFYCQVLVGDSQKWTGRHCGDVRDTIFKDQVKRIRYQSMTDFLQGSNVFVVYKNRRAYPSYLIKYQIK